MRKLGIPSGVKVGVVKELCGIVGVIKRDGRYYSIGKVKFWDGTEDVLFQLMSRKEYYLFRIRRWWRGVRA